MKFFLEHMGAVTSDLSALSSKAFMSDGMLGAIVAMEMAAYTDWHMF